jgi:glycosyltransferase involved in cell wall biosynthesis
MVRALVPRHAGGMLHVVIPVHEAARWHDRCLTSLRTQRHTDWRAVVVVDPGGDDTLAIARRHAAEDTRIVALEAPRRRWQLANRLAGVGHLAPPADGVVVNIDGDDWWAHDRALEQLAALYADPEVWFTYGSFATWKGSWLDRRGRAGPGSRRPGWRVPLSRRPPGTSPYPEAALARGAIRPLGWRAGHPITFRRHLLDAVRPEDLRDREGRFLRSATDAALVYPMLEMCGPRHARHVPDVLYVYNKANAAGRVRSVPGEQRRWLRHLQQRAPYAPLAAGREPNP